MSDFWKVKIINRKKLVGCLERPFILHELGRVKGIFISMHIYIYIYIAFFSYHMFCPMVMIVVKEVEVMNTKHIKSVILLNQLYVPVGGVGWGDWITRRYPTTTNQNVDIATWRESNPRSLALVMPSSLCHTYIQCWLWGAVCSIIIYSLLLLFLYNDFFEQFLGKMPIQ